ncbi:MAG: isocitrate lyase/PEP mutase family protein [Cohaesibacteraceae bacterium]|nr:isocitrate lyase/PEP mutase family protein [Cohaesibacteraceae bacterium]
MTRVKRFRKLLQSKEIIVSPGVYDGYSARLVEQMGFKTACSTGAGLANSRLAVPDTGVMGLTDNLDAVRMMARAIDIPLMADADTGYGNPVTVFHTTRYFEEAGVVGINIEDQVSPKRCGHMEGKSLIDMREMARKIEAACDARRDDDFVILARTDAISVEGIDNAIKRAKLYEAAGADMIFADAIKSEEQIKQLVNAVSLPVSVNIGFGIRSRPTTPLIPIKRLHELGVKRVTIPRILPAAAILSMRKALEALMDSTSSDVVPDRTDLLTDIDDIWNLMGESNVAAQELKYLDLDSIKI